MKKGVVRIVRVRYYEATGSSITWNNVTHASYKNSLTKLFQATMKEVKSNQDDLDDLEKKSAKVIK